MKKPMPVQYLPKAERLKEETLIFLPCKICQKQITAGYFGRWEDGGVCSKKCDSEYERRRENELAKAGATPGRQAGD